MGENAGESRDRPEKPLNSARIDGTIDAEVSTVSTEWVSWAVSVIPRTPIPMLHCFGPSGAVSFRIVNTKTRKYLIRDGQCLLLRPIGNDGKYKESNRQYKKIIRSAYT